MELQRKQY